MYASAMLLRLAALCLPVLATEAVRPPLHTGEPCGVEVVNDNITLYVTGKPSDVAVLYLTDVFGIQLLENKLLADSFARAGFLTVAPDMFNGTPAPADLNDPDFDVGEFLAKHNPTVIDPMLDSTIAYIKEELGIDTVVATGYCFGGRHTFRTMAEGRGVSVGFTAHPSAWEDSEVEALTGPVSVAAAEFDDLMPPELRLHLEELLSATPQEFSVSLYSGTEHGFGVRANVSVPIQKFGKEEAFYQAVKWFKTWA